jgi:transcriptional regulator with XRE-family HTH domain
MHPVRRLREKRKMTLIQAGRELGISAPSLSRIENGVHGASDALKRRIVAWSGGKITASELLNYQRDEASAA